MIKVYQTGILPLGHFDITDSDLGNIEGGEVLVFDEAPLVAGERTVPDVYQNGTRANLRLATIDDIGPFFLANMDKNSGQFSTPGFEKSSAFSVNTAFAQDYDSSSKISIFSDEGFYSISSDRFVDGYITTSTPINSRLYVGANGLLTTEASASGAQVGFFIEFRQDTVLNNNLNRPFYTAGTHQDADTIIIYKTNADGYLDSSDTGIGAPSDGTYTDGYFAFTPATTIADAVDNFNEVVSSIDTKLTNKTSSKSWGFETANAAAEYAGGFYIFSGTDNDFSPSITLGTANVSYAAHVLIVTGAVPVDNVSITITGTSITDSGVRVGSDSEIISVATNTAANSCFETAKKWLGQVTIETTAGTAITANYGFSKYWDNENRDFDILGLEALWTAEATDSTSNIELIHHKATGWTFNAGADPTPPVLASRTTDHGADIGHVDGVSGAWKRTNFATRVVGSDSEGVLWRITSANAGVNNQSFRTLNLEIVMLTV
jgi:hypothetical protein